MIRRKIGQAAILNRLNRLETAQSNKKHIGVIMFSSEDDGRIATRNLEKKCLYFETMFDAENYLIDVPGVTEKTVLMIDDIILSPDLYLPLEPILYCVDSVERKQFIDAALTPKEWLPLYINLIQRLLVLAAEQPNIPLPGFDAPALQDLLANYNSMSVEQLIERYKDQKWFTGKTLC